MPILPCPECSEPIQVSMISNVCPHCGLDIDGHLVPANQILDIQRTLDSVESEHYEAKVDLEPGAAVVYYNRGLAGLEEGEYAQACSNFSVAILGEYEDLHYAYSSRAICYFEMGDYEQAFSDFGTAINSKPEDPDAWRNRGVAYKKLGKVSLAEADLKKAEELGCQGS